MNSPTTFDDRYDEPDQLRDQLRRLLRYRTTIALGIALGLLGGLLLTFLRSGTYTSTGEVLVRSTVDPFSPFGVSVDNQVSMGTERQIALSSAVAIRAAKALREPSRADALLKDLRVGNPPDTQVLRFQYTAGTAKRAARVTNAFVDAYLADRQERTDSVVRRMAGGLERQVAALTKRDKPKIDTATRQSLRDQINVLHKRISDIRAHDTSGGDIVRRAEPPARPAGEGPVALLGLGLLSGAAVGVMLAWLRSALEPRARSVAEVQAALHAPVLGIIPPRVPAPTTGGTRTDPATGTGGGDLLEVGRVGGSRAEAYRTLAFRLRRGEGLTAGSTLLVVAPKQDRNAEAAAVNLAAAFAESGDDVLLVDAAGAPGLAGRLPLEPADPADSVDVPGPAEYVDDLRAATPVAAGDSTAAADPAARGDSAPAVERPEGRVVVDAGTAGRFALYPDRRDATTDEVPTSPSVTRVLLCADGGTTVFVVTRPLLEHSDGLAVAQRVDGVLVVGDTDRTRRDDLKRIRELVGLSGGRLVGAVLDTGTRRSRLRDALESLRRPMGRGAAAQEETVPEDVRQPEAEATDGTPADDAVRDAGVEAEADEGLREQPQDTTAENEKGEKSETDGTGETDEGTGNAENAEKSDKSEKKNVRGASGPRGRKDPKDAAKGPKDAQDSSGAQEPSGAPDPKDAKAPKADTAKEEEAAPDGVAPQQGSSAPDETLTASSQG
ncbi:hypothetical protein ACFPM3_17655 [Streptomyces coeruleoprunus]|uniref:Lipopolysaccharide biosynthesis protein n=1 Tax=Streptomyces coeruleoprunus TaxID=285563 RepID=A0ABV9XK82_9ACTN